MEGIQTPFAHSAPRGSLDVPSSAKDAFQGFAHGGVSMAMTSSRQLSSGIVLDEAFDKVLPALPSLDE